MEKDFPVDLFDWAERFQRTRAKRTRTVLCLDCNKVEMTLTFNDQSGIFEGKRICKVCKMSYKQRYAAGW